SGLGLVHHDAGVLFVGAVPVHQVGRFPHLDLQAALGLCLAPSGAAADAQVGGQHVVLVSVVGADDVGVAQTGGVCSGDHGGLAAVDRGEAEEVVPGGGCLVDPLIGVGLEVGRGVTGIGGGPALLGDGEGELPRIARPVQGGAGGHGDLYVSGTVCGPGDDPAPGIGIGRAGLGSLVVLIGGGDDIRVGGGPGDGGSVLGAAGDQRQVAHHRFGQFDRL